MENLTQAHVWKVQVRKNWLSHGGGHLCFQRCCGPVFQGPEPVSSLLVLSPSRLFCCTAVKVKGTFGATARGTVRAHLSLDQHSPRRVQTYGPVPAGDSKRAAPWVSGKRAALSLVSPHFLLPAPSGEAVGSEEEDRVDQGCCRFLL